MKALIIGATGGFGKAMARELLERGADVTAMVRPGGRTPDVAGLWQVEADALDADAVRRAAAGMDVIVYGFNVPYPQWKEKAFAAADHAARAAEAEGATLLFPGNVYGLGPRFDAPLDEAASLEAPTFLGSLRNDIEARLREASERGARVIVVRAGDFFGPGAPNGWFEIMVARVKKGGAILDPGAAGVRHAWAYLPDLAHAAARLLERRDALAPFEVFHFAGHAATSDEMIGAIRAALGDPERKVRAFPWWAIGLLRPLWPMAGFLRALRYLWTEPVLLADGKLRAELGELSETSLEEAVSESLGVGARRQERRCFAAPGVAA